jgi:hypothetical protein
MIGYAPFLGQVRFAGHPNLRRLGQAEVEIPSGDVFGLDTTIRSIIQQAPHCVTASNPVMEAIGFKIGRATRDGTSAMLTQDEMAIIRRMQECWNQVGGVPPRTVSSQAEGIPTWGYVVGGLAAAGLIAYLATH